MAGGKNLVTYRVRKTCAVTDFGPIREVFGKMNHPTNKLAALEKTPTPWHSSKKLSRKTEIILTRLHVSHLFTHLMPRICVFCGIDILLSVKHFFECPELTNLWETFKTSPPHLIALSDKSLSIQNLH